MNKFKVSVIIVNWNGWKDTIMCLSSLFAMDYKDFQVIVCDNGSSDGSIMGIKAWADGNPFATSGNYKLLSKKEAEDGVVNARSDLVIVDVGENLGFAGGINVGLRHVIACGESDYVWLLNNDTTVAPDALSKLVQCLEREPSVDVCGSTLLDFENPTTVLSCGGGFLRRRSGLALEAGRGMLLDECLQKKEIADDLDYISGASFFASTKTWKQFGLLSEDYFLYYEELDWHHRSAEATMRWCSESFVYHKEGASAGSKPDPRQSGLYADYFSVRSRMIFMNKYYPHLKLFTIASLMASVFNRLRFGLFFRGFLMACLMLCRPCADRIVFGRLGARKS